jgi:hypothetical protein
VFVFSALHEDVSAYGNVKGKLVWPPHKSRLFYDIDIDTDMHRSRLTDNLSKAEDEFFWTRMIEETLGSLTSPPAPASQNCGIDLSMVCQSETSNVACTDLKGEEQIQCTCSDCVRELLFRYTGNPCNEGFESCIDQRTWIEDATLLIYKADDLNDILFTETVIPGSEFVVRRAEGDCIADSIAVQVVSAVDGQAVVRQSSIIDTTCDGRRLSLLDSYGALDFIGYSCSEKDVHNCFIDVTYTLTACNTDDASWIIKELEFTNNGETTDLLATVDSDDLLLSSDECYEAIAAAVIERCADGEYRANATVAVETLDGAVCEDEEDLKFSLMVGSAPSTQTPSTPAPGTSEPTPGTPETMVPSSPPVTSAPSTAAPSTSAPETSAPTTPAPRTSEPTPGTPETFVPSSPPNTTAPSTAAPSISAPETSEPTPGSPETSEPTSPNPSSSPTARPATPESLPPTTSPSEVPTTIETLPTDTSSDSPSVPPSSMPSDIPSAPPSSMPTNNPRAPPSEFCGVDLQMECQTVEGEAPCADLREEDDIQCSCVECVREMRFKYTANLCDQSDENCEDVNGGPQAVANMVITGDGSEELYSNTVEIGREIRVGHTDGSCLPAALSVIVSLQGSISSSQLQTIDSSCSGQGLLLKNSFGSLDFIGYTCSAGDEHNCFVDVMYVFQACNTDQVNVKITDMQLVINGNITDLQDGVPSGLLELEPTDCFATMEAAVVNRCSSIEYSAESSVSTTSLDGEVCEDVAELQFMLEKGTSPPTPTTLPPSPTPESHSPSPECMIDISLDCEPVNSVGSTCDTIPILSPICGERPFQMTFRYLGGGCSQSFNVQPQSYFRCEDFNGGPPAETNATSYIIAYDLEGTEIYFTGFAEVGESYVLNALDRFSANMNITIYDPKGSTEPSEIVSAANILQTVKYHSSCSQDLYLKDRFGSSQLVEWVSETIGRVTCFINATISLSVQIPIQASQESAVITSLSIVSNVFGTFNQTDEVNGLVFEGGETVTPAPFTVQLDLTSRRRYSFLTSIVIQSNTSGEAVECQADRFFEFTTGNPLPPIFPTIAPTSSPTLTPYPTPDPETAACELNAVVDCSVVDGPVRSCEELRPSKSGACTGIDLELNELRFVYTGEGVDGAAPVVIEISDAAMGIYVSETYGVGATITVSNPTGFLDDTLNVAIYLAAPSKKDGKGSTVQEFDLDVQCLTTATNEAPSLVLGRDYGPLKLISFTTEQDGRQDSVAELQIIYRAENQGIFPAFVSSAIVDSFFSGLGQEQINGTAVLAIPRFDSIILFTEKVSIDLRTNMSQPILFGLRLEGEAGTSAAVPCDSFDILFLSQF